MIVVKKIGIVKKCLVIWFANSIATQNAYPETTLHLTAHGVIAAAPTTESVLSKNYQISKTVEVQHTNCRGQTNSNWINISAHEAFPSNLQFANHTVKIEKNCQTTNNIEILTY
jgi:hypothetical protein